MQMSEELYREYESSYPADEGIEVRGILVFTDQEQSYLFVSEDAELEPGTVFRRPDSLQFVVLNKAKVEGKLHYYHVAVYPG